jgi:tyrosinase
VIDRREFIVALGATGIISFGTARPINAQSLRVRRSINNLEPDDPIVATLRRGVELMHELDSKDERSWAAQARIHLDHCHRKAHHFLPWHRAYLHYFEEIVRELTGDEAWALPYWDWATYPQVPTHFWGIDEPLDPRRWNDPNSLLVGDGHRLRGPDEVVSISQSCIDTLLRNVNYRVFNSRLSNGTHGRVHIFIGGHMSNFLSPLDPVFWCHHANVDRLWEKWLSEPDHSNPADVNWLDEPFDNMFSDRSGALVQSLQTRSVLNSFTLGYAYDDVPFRIRPERETLFLSSLPKEFSLKSADPFVEPDVSASNEIPIQVGIPVPISLELTDRTRIDPSFTDVLAARSAGLQHHRILARLSDIQVPSNAQGYEIRVFLNCPYLEEDTPKDDPHFVADASLFGLREMTMPDGSKMDMPGRQIIVDLTEAMVALNARRTPVIETANLQIIGVRDGLDSLEGDEFTIGRAEITVLDV